MNRLPITISLCSLLLTQGCANFREEYRYLPKEFIRSIWGYNSKPENYQPIYTQQQVSLASNPKQGFRSPLPCMTPVAEDRERGRY